MKHIVFYDGTNTHILKTDRPFLTGPIADGAETFDSFDEAKRAAAQHLRQLRNDYGNALRRIQGLRNHEIPDIKLIGD